MTRRAFALGLLALPGLPQDLPPLHDAAAQGRADEVNRLIVGNLALIHSLDKDGNTPLHHAAWNNRYEAARILILAGAMVDARRGRESDGVTALESACYFGHFELVKLLVENKANVNVRIYEGYTPLHQAVRNGHVAVAQYLVEHGARLDDARANGRTPLHTAAESGQTETTLLLLALGANPTTRARDGLTPVGVASNDGVRQLLLKALVARAETEARQAARALTVPKEAPVKKVEIVYESRFASGTVGPEWSTSALGGQWAELQTGMTPRGDRQFLGPFGSQEVRLALGKLPTHQVVRIACDVLILGTWDGNGTPGFGPDLWELSLLDGPTLLSATFFNPDAATTGASLQSFPDNYPLGNHLGGTGAIEKREGLAVYRLAYNVTHSAESAVFRFSARGLEGLENESWALTGVRVATLALK